MDEGNRPARTTATPAFVGIDPQFNRGIANDRIVGTDPDLVGAAARTARPGRPDRTSWPLRALDAADVDPGRPVPHPTDPIRVDPHVAIGVGQWVLHGGRWTGRRDR